jgi:hypothetical protein
MKSILTQIFVGLGVLFLILILFALYFFITDPFNIKPMLFGSSGSGTQTEKTTVTTTKTLDSTGTSEVTTSATGGFELSLPNKSKHS